MLDIEAVLGRLLTLQINTIVSKGILVERMPPDGRALIRIAQRYHDFLVTAIEDTVGAGGNLDALPLVLTAPGPAVAFTDWDVRSGGTQTFTLLHAAAALCLDVRREMPTPHALRPDHDAVLLRVAGNCHQIMDVLHNLHLDTVPVTQATVSLAEEAGIVWPAFDGETLLLLRRIWETGVDVVVMQTLVQLDGGVVTRVLDGRDDAEDGTLHAIHYKAVDVSLGRWTLLVQTATEIAGFFLGGGRGTDSVRAAAALPADTAAGGARAAAV